MWAMSNTKEKKPDQLIRCVQRHNILSFVLGIKSDLEIWKILEMVSVLSTFCIKGPIFYPVC